MLRQETTMRPLKQRSHEWRLKRLGNVTASRFRDVLTQPRTKRDREDGVMSATARGYLEELLCEHIIGLPMDRFASQATRWGNDWEESAFDAAKSAVEKRCGVTVDMPINEYASIEHCTEELISCSPDGMIGDDGMLELKCPFNPANHLRTVLAGGMPSEHMPQVQGSLWITGRKWYAFGSFDPRFEATALDPLCLYIVERDDEYIASLGESVLAFRDVLVRSYQKIVADYEHKTEAPF